MGRPAGLRRPSQPLLAGLAALAAAVLWGCGGGGVLRLPPARPIIVSSGERIRVDPPRMDTIYLWLTEENENIQLDPTFLIDGVPAARESLPWQSMEIVGDTARLQYDRAHPDAGTAFNIYAHLHLMKQMDRLDEWLPEHADAEGFELERAIVARMSDAWLLGRAVFDAPAYGPLDQVMYAREAGFLDAYLLVAREDEFPDARERWLEDDPGQLAEFEAWFRRVFESDPPRPAQEEGER